MVDAAPFRALCYDPDVAGDPLSTSAPAYDELEALTYARHRTASPYTVLELLAPSRAAGDYAWSSEVLRRWLRTGVLREDAEPSYYLYEEHELRAGVPTVQRGILAAVAVADPAVLTHEEVEPARVADRAARLSAVPVDLAPVFGVYPRGPAALQELLRRRPRTPPVLRLTDESGIDHRIWRLDEPADVAAIRTGLEQTDVVIADGHHRFAAAQSVGQDRTLMYLVDGHEHGPQILPVHRVVRSGAAALLSLQMPGVRLVPGADDIDSLVAQLHATPSRAWGVRAAGRSGVLEVTDEAALQAALPRGRSLAWRTLDTAVFEQAVLPRLGGVDLTYRTDLAAAVAEADASAGDAVVVFRPVDIDAVYACAVAREPMPAKTTWFRPKPRAGLVMRSLHSAEWRASSR